MPALVAAIGIKLQSPDVTKCICLTEPDCSDHSVQAQSSAAIGISISSSSTSG